VFRFVFILCAVLFGSAVAAGQADSDYDGYPDAVEITSAEDRAAFMAWFASVAEAQYTAPSPDWAYQDCSGLLRYAFVEALKTKDAAWFDKFAYLPEWRLPPVRKLSFPVPLLSRSVFRTAPGPYHITDVETGRLVGLATAEELLNYASVPLGRNPGVAQRGDLLFFVHPLASGSGYHSMVYLGDGMVVYHTGLTPEEGGEVRLLSLATLARNPDRSWHPVAENPNFLGFYRWKILD
jgi:uncharacterized protein YfaT (DUF1175 family)